MVAIKLFAHSTASETVGRSADETYHVVLLPCKGLIIHASIVSHLLADGKPLVRLPFSMSPLRCALRFPPRLLISSRLRAHAANRRMCRASGFVGQVDSLVLRPSHVGYGNCQRRKQCCGYERNFPSCCILKGCRGKCHDQGYGDDMCGDDDDSANCRLMRRDRGFASKQQGGCESSEQVDDAGGHGKQRQSDKGANARWLVRDPAPKRFLRLPAMASHQRKERKHCQGAVGGGKDGDAKGCLHSWFLWVGGP